MTKQLKTIIRNMLVLYVNRKFEDLLEYRRACQEGLNRHDLAAIKRGFHDAVINR